MRIMFATVRRVPRTPSWSGSMFVAAITATLLLVGSVDNRPAAAVPLQSASRFAPDLTSILAGIDFDCERTDCVLPELWIDVKNYSYFSSAKRFTVAVSYGGHVQRVTVPGLTPYATVRVRFVRPQCIYGQLNVIVIVDADNEVRESDETNNRFAWPLCPSK